MTRTCPGRRNGYVSAPRNVFASASSGRRHPLRELGGAGHPDPAVHLLRVDDDERDPGIPLQMTKLEAAARRVEAHDLVALGVDPDDGRVRRAVRPQRRHGADEGIVLQEGALRGGEAGHVVTTNGLAFLIPSRQRRIDAWPSCCCGHRCPISPAVASIRSRADRAGALVALEGNRPAISGWMLDERGRSGATSTCSSTASSRGRRRPSAARTGSTSCPRSQEDEMTELLVGTKKGLFVLEGEPRAAFEVTARAFAGEPVEYAMRDPRSGRVPRLGDLAVLRRPKIWLRRRPGRRVAAGRGRRAARGRRRGARADLGDRAGRGRRRPLRRRRPRRAVREPRRRRDVGAQPRPLGAPDAAGVAAGRRRAVPALDRALAGRARPARGRRSPPSASGSPTTAARPGARQQRHRPRATCPRTRRTRRSSSASTTSAARAARPERLFMQFHGGVYRSDDAGASWIDIGDGRPAVGLRLPARGRPGRPRQRLRDPAHRRRGPGDARRRACASTRRATRARPGRRAATGCRSGDAYLTDPARGVRLGRRGRRRSSSTSAPPRARSSAPATRARTGRRSPTHLPPVYSVRTA